MFQKAIFRYNFLPRKMYSGVTKTFDREKTMQILIPSYANKKSLSVFIQIFLSKDVFELTYPPKSAGL